MSSTAVTASSPAPSAPVAAAAAAGESKARSDVVNDGGFMAKAAIKISEYDKFTRVGIIGYETMFEAAAAVLEVPRASKVLVVGSGSGQELITFAKQARAADAPSDFSLVGRDPAPAMIELAAQRMADELTAEQRAHIDNAQGFVADLPLSDARYRDFDAAACILVLHGLVDDESPTGKAALLRSITARLRPGAKLFMVDHTGVRESPEYAARIDQWADFCVARGLAADGRAKFRQSQLTLVQPMSEARTRELLASLHLHDIVPVFGSFTIRGIVATYRPPSDTAPAPAAASS